MRRRRSRSSTRSVAIFFATSGSVVAEVPAGGNERFAPRADVRVVPEIVVVAEMTALMTSVDAGPLSARHIKVSQAEA